ncbi:hypothetical protein BJ165DRAFT_1407451 [Panaeolus papilionaceus]|nr:hypothetical protein BJ165DRAFT_1407451 [Panaeolus papilionaceus]
MDKYVASSAPRLNDDMKRRRTSRSISLGFFCIVFFSFAVFGLAMLATIGFIRALSKPHASDYVYPMSGTLPGSAVLKPLIGKRADPGGLFDIYATVWMRVPKLAWPESGQEPERDSAIQSPSESVLFSGTVFTAIHLQEKNLRTAIELQIPTDIFKNRVVGRTDLRASFVLIPLSPSPLDDAVNISTINAERRNSLPVRPYPSPYQHSMLDNIIDSYGISTSLLDFQPYPVRCNESGPGISNINLLDHNPTFPMDTNEEAIVSTMKVGNITMFLTRGWSVGIRTIQAHPYIITRTFLRVAEMTLLYDNKAYDEQHQALKTTRMACAKNQWTDNWCDRRFETYGNFETTIGLETRDPVTSEPIYEWAYAPYMSTADKAWGPKDLVPIPLTADVCTPPSTDSTLDPSIETGQDVSFVNVTWHVTYSGRAPGKLISGDLISASDNYALEHGGER